MAKKEAEQVEDLSNYLNRLASRISLLETQSNEVSNVVSDGDSRLNEVFDDFKLELESIKNSVNNLNTQVGNVMRDITILVREFKNLAKNERFEHLQRKIDDWSPESFVTRNEVKKVLKK